MISGLLLIISTVNSKIVQEYAAISHQSLESTKCGDKKNSDCLSRFFILSRRRWLAGRALVTSGRV